QSLGLVLHELATNAAKYGALSVPEGHLHVAWTIRQGAPPTLALDWRETDGPPASVPEHQGFGLRLIERSLDYDLGGKAQLTFEAQGLHAQLTLPLDPAIARSGFAPPPAAVASPPPGTGLADRDLAGLGVLVVEDEALVALDVAAALRGAGCAVVGPVGRLEAALKLAGEEALDAAVLDVNLGGPMVFPVAEALRARGIPFVFLTGYEEGFLPPALRGERRVAKPLRPTELLSALAQAVAATERAKAS
ncbi:MAG: histidine kinase, partial [Alphaproteobacteria bacterium]